MLHTELTDDIRDTAALYSLGALSVEEVRGFEEHLAAGCVVCREEVQIFNATAAYLPLAVAEIEPPPSLRDRVLESIREYAPGMHVVRHTEGKWRPSPFPGVRVKTLHVDREAAMMTNLVRIEPGASYPAHRHSAVEQCLVVEGDIRLDQVVLGPGDYTRNEVSSNHARIHSQGGCLLLIISSTKDELLE